ncbi:MAG: hypothetical protein GF399_11605 [Candidatus Coatesbacteria bacterium]|nr:hypothetical protein [Candidatus Coatesbacteria bacterium]
MKQLATTALVLATTLLPAGCGEEPAGQAVTMPPAPADAAGTSRVLLEADELLGEALSDFQANNFGLALDKVRRARELLEPAARIELPLICVAQHVYVADAHLRFGGDPGEAKRRLEQARDLLKECIIDAAPAEKELHGAFLERLIAVIEDADVDIPDKLAQLETLQRDLAEAVVAAERPPVGEH